jgi:hypothetical protein
MTNSPRGTLVVVALVAACLAAWGCSGTKNRGPATEVSPNGPPPYPDPGGAAPGAEGPGPNLRQTMNRIGKGDNALDRLLERELQADAPAWETIQPQAAEYARLTADLGKATPRKGSQESWAKLAAAFAESAAALDRAAKAQDVTAARKAQETLHASCMECHRQHRGGPGGPGGFGPGGPGGRGPGGPPR